MSLPHLCLKTNTIKNRRSASQKSILNFTTHNISKDTLSQIKGIYLMNAAVVKAAIYKLNWSQDDLSDSLSLFYRFLFEKLSGENTDQSSNCSENTVFYYVWSV